MKKFAVSLLGSFLLNENSEKRVSIPVSVSSAFILERMTFGKKENDIFLGTATGAALSVLHGFISGRNGRIGLLSSVEKNKGNKQVFIVSQNSIFNLGKKITLADLSNIVSANKDPIDLFLDSPTTTVLFYDSVKQIIKDIPIRERFSLP